MKPRTVRGRSTSPEGRAVLHESADESFVRGQELRCAEEGLCMTEDLRYFLTEVFSWKFQKCSSGHLTVSIFVMRSNKVKKITDRSNRDGED